jgi:hypothetical protein
MTLWDWVDWIVAAYPLITLFAAFVLIALNGSQSYAAGWNAAMAYVHNNRDEVKRYWRENRD